jgi:bifunctional non-homologous end joining protein LigD
MRGGIWINSPTYAAGTKLQRLFLHSGKYNQAVQLCAFDILCRMMTISGSCRCRWGSGSLSSPTARRIFAEPIEQGEVGPDLYSAACRSGLEGLVSKKANRPYRAGRSKDWVKVKNRERPAYWRVKD